LDRKDFIGHIDASWDNESSFVQTGVVLKGRAVCERFRLQGHQFTVDGSEFESAYVFAGLMAGKDNN
jgi:hypothetical protein